MGFLELGRGRKAMGAARWLAAASLLHLVGCYTYAPITVDSALPGARVRARLTPAAADEIRELLGLEARVLEGEVLAARRDTLVLAVPSGSRAAGFHLETLHQRLAVPTDRVIEIELKELDRTRTVALVGLATLGVGLLAWAALGGETGGTRDAGAPPAESVR